VLPLRRSRSHLGEIDEVLETRLDVSK
jgi:hypothetical protein